MGIFCDPEQSVILSFVWSLCSKFFYVNQLPNKVIYNLSFFSYSESQQFPMYNQFTAVDQKPLPLGRVLLDPMAVPKANKRKKKKLHSKNPYKIKKIKLLGQEAMREKHVDGLLLLKMLHFQHPKEIISANISYKRIVSIEADHLEYFSNMVELNCSQNYLKLEMLRKLPAVENINISHNSIKEIDIQHNLGGFNCLQILNLSFNNVGFQYISQLSLLPSLTDLDLSYNQLQELPADMTNFSLLQKLNLEGNKFKSDHKASNFWSALASIPSLQILSVARNQIRGIHTEKLVAGNFSTLIQLDFSYNIVENQHNLICSRNFTSLKKIYITGNPFAISNQYKGLEMEVFARTGALVIIQNTNPYYLKKQKAKPPPIRFEKLVKIAPNDTFKKKNNLFGIQLPQEADLFSSDSDEQLQPQSEESDQEEPMFVTQQLQKNKGNNKKSKGQQNSQSGSSNINIDQDLSDIPAQSEGSQFQKKQQNQLQQSNLKSSMKSSMKGSLSGASASKSIEYGQFHKVAAELLGNEKQYKKGFDIHTSYKALKKALDRAGED